MSTPTFDNLVSKFKEGTKQAADTLGRKAKIAKLRMEIMSLNGEKTGCFQNIGNKTYNHFCQNNRFDHDTLTQQLKAEFDRVSTIEAKIKDLEQQIAEVQNYSQDPDTTNAWQVKEVEPR